MYYRSGTDGRCCILSGRRFVSILQVAALFCIKWHHGQHLVSVTSNRKSDSVAHSLEERSCQVSIWNDGALRLFEERRHNNNNKKMSTDMGSVPDKKNNNVNDYNASKW